LKTKDILELAGDPRFISGIYNYCDRWCERCQFTSRCLLYAQERDSAGDTEANDIHNEAFWERMTDIFKQTSELLRMMAAERGIDLDSIDYEEVKAQKRTRDAKTRSHELSRSAKRYSHLVKDWFESQFPGIEQALGAGGRDDLPLVDFDHQDKVERVGEAVEVIRWYQFQIAVKIMRGLMHDDDEDEENAELNLARQKDSDGSVKVALLGMSRSIGAWGRLSEEFPDQASEMVPLLVHLERLRRKTEVCFPNAMNFIRPGFDEASDAFVS
jgi:hypothetical protein